jgi:hypothetical protein
MDNLFLCLVNKANVLQNLFLVYLSISTRFGRLGAHHQGACYSETSGEFKLQCVCHVSHVENDKYTKNKYTKNKYTKNKLCTKLLYL